MKATSARSAAAMVLLGLALTGANFASAQTFKKVSVKGNVKMMKVAAGGASVWALSTNGIPYVYKTSKFLPASTISMTQIAVGGGSLRQPDTVWALDSAGRPYNIVKNGTTWAFNLKPGTLSVIAAGIGYQDNCHPYEVWGLNPSAEIYRFNYCLGDWEVIPGTLGMMSVNGGEVWGVNGDGGAYRFDFPSMSFVLVRYLTTSVSVRAGDAWMVYHDRGGPNLITRYDLQYGSSLFGDAPQVQAGGDGVWAIRPDGSVHRFELNQDAQNHFTLVPGVTLSTISVGSGAGVWGIDASGQVFAFSTP